MDRNTERQTNRRPTNTKYSASHDYYMGTACGRQSNTIQLAIILGRGSS